MFITVKKFNELQAENEALKAKLTAAEKQRDETLTIAGDLQTKLADTTIQLGGVVEKLAAKTKEFDELADKAAKLAVDVDQKANVKALEIVAAQGVAPLAVSTIQAETIVPSLSFRDQFMAIKGAKERAAFWSAHSEDILDGK